ncbi:MAG: hypothetical protein CVU64_00635 [Deltaproteobacteria bacterium HGW-Deltaproteobacteria-21]|nr:MAG: hypothetical protein CVU64_00635 [Deltaproteobacteria bacterium HGW-Deltaproteobacteria-21]
MKPLGKARQVLLYAGPFPALAFFKIWAASGPSSGSLTIVAFLMLAFCATVIGFALKWDKPTYFDWTVALYFVVISLSLTAWPDAAGRLLTKNSVTGIYLCLFAASFFPPLLGMDPFTSHYAKKSTPRVFWDNPVFISINRIMTYSWAGIFAVSAALSLYPSVITRALIPLAVILGLGVPFNILFPDFYLRRRGLPTLRQQKKMGEVVESVQRQKESSAAPAVKPPETAPRETVYRKKEGAMKILALNSSPRSGGDSKTELMMNSLVQGMREAGADVDVVDLRKKKINPCSGCFTCWTKTPGVCIHKDDMTSELFPKFLQSDLVVYASPLYHFTVNAAMKTFIERTLPILQPFLNETGGGATGHPLRQPFPKAVILSVAGFPEMSVFDQLSAWVRFLFGRGGNLVAEIYRPAAESLVLPFFKEKSQEILGAVKEAGQEIVKDMKVAPETLARVTQDIAGGKEVIRKMANLMWKSCIAEGITPREFMERGVAPRPDSIETFMMVFSMGFNPDAAGETKAILQFHFSGETEGSCHFRIENRRIEAIDGRAQNPDLTIESPFELWMDIMTGKADGQQMFMDQKYRATGDFSLLIRLSQLFGK